VNEAKRRIDAAAAQAAAQRDAKLADADGGAAGRALGEELAAAKRAYRARFEELGAARSESEYLARVADSLAAQAARDFGRHWARLCGMPDSAAASMAAMPQALPSQGPAGAGGASGAAQEFAPLASPGGGGGGGGGGAFAARIDGEAAYRAGLAKTQAAIEQSQAASLRRAAVAGPGAAGARSPRPR
jgi:hypothetical protein